VIGDAAARGVANTDRCPSEMPRYPRKRERNVSKSIGAAVCPFALIAAGGVAAQGMLVDFAADKVIKKYEAATCEQLKAQKDEPRTEREKMAIDFLRKRFAGAGGLHRQGRCAHSEQDVRVRPDPVRQVRGVAPGRWCLGMESRQCVNS